MSKILRVAALGAVIAAPIGAYLLVARPWMRRWGVEPGSAGAVLPGDGLIEDPTVIETRSLEIGALPADVWPWLVQMGFGRAGWYSYDQLNQKAPSADEIAPEWQTLAVGDTMPAHSAGGFVVKILEPERALVLYVDSEMTATWRAKVEPEDTDVDEADDAEAAADRAEDAAAAVANFEAPAELEEPADLATPPPGAQFQGSWAFVLEPTADGQTRLIERLRFRFDGAQPVGAELAMEAMGFGVFLMMRRQMLGIRDRAERTAQSKLPVPVPMGLTSEPLPA